MVTEICYPDSTDWSCYDGDIADVDDAVRIYAETLAWSTLSRLTAGRIALCPTVLRPASLGCITAGSYQTDVVGRGGGYFRPYMLNGLIYNACGCYSRSSCECLTPETIRLPGPVNEIDEIRVAGVVLDPELYRVDNGDLLIRMDGGTWPVWQDLSLPADDASAFTVSYYEGVAPNVMLNKAAGLLASEFLAACIGGDCRLPNGVTSIVRQGVSMEIRTDLFDVGGTGIQEIDAIVGIYNPYKLKARPYVLSVDGASRGRVETWPR